MLVDIHVFDYAVAVPWPYNDSPQINWWTGVGLIEYWLQHHVGQHYKVWAWNDSGRTDHIGVAFRWDQHRLLFLIAWS